VQGLFTAQTLTRRFVTLQLYHVYVCLSVNVSVLIDEHNAGHSGRSEIVF
jgi:hypothetical protein